MEFNLETFLFETPLYTNIIIENINDESFQNLFYDYFRFDIEGYNSIKGVQSTFSITRALNYRNNEIFDNGGFGTIILTCKRYFDDFIFLCCWEPQTKTIVKVGQYPSIADLHINEIKKYSKLLSKEKLKEFTRAIGLSANGVGIGSYVYLRRIFEYLITIASEKAIDEKAINKSDFQHARMEEKIDLLKSYLPSFLVENKSMYSILSLGIHELDENTCLTHFETLRIGIELILDEQLDEMRKKEKIEIAKKKLNNLNGNIKK